MHDPDLIAKLLCGDEEAFRCVVEEYQSMVLNCSFKFLRNRELAEDVTQEVFLEVFESIGSFRRESRLSTWIYRIAVTKSLNVLKSQQRKKRFAGLLSLFGEEKIEERIQAPDSDDPSVRVEDLERATMLASALEKLPDTQRIAFTLSKTQDMSYEEIASIMKVTIPAVESLIHRAKANLRKHLSHVYLELRA